MAICVTIRSEIVARIAADMTKATGIDLDVGIPALRSTCLLTDVEVVVHGQDGWHGHRMLSVTRKGHTG